MAASLEAAREDGDPTPVAAALGDIGRAKGMTQVARAIGPRFHSPGIRRRSTNLLPRRHKYTRLGGRLHSCRPCSRGLGGPRRSTTRSLLCTGGTGSGGYRRPGRPQHRPTRVPARSCALSRNPTPDPWRERTSTGMALEPQGAQAYPAPRGPSAIPAAAVPCKRRTSHANTPSWSPCLAAAS